MTFVSPRRRATMPVIDSCAALQLGYAGTKISSLKELFEFAKCVDPRRQILWNIESKINPIASGATRSVEEFVTKQHAEFVASGYNPSQITVCTFSYRFGRHVQMYLVPEL